MDISRRAVAVGGLGLFAGTSLGSATRAEARWAPGKGLEEFWLATDAYIYGYPLLTMEMTRRVITNVAAPEGTRAPMGQLIRLREYPNASFRDVTAPNADTLCTTAFFDVGKEPWIVSIPDMKGRCFLMPFLDGWTNVFAVPGPRTTGTGAQTYGITGPGWKGTLPAGVKNTGPRPAWFGCSAASIAPERRRTTPPCMRSRSGSAWCRSRTRQATDTTARTNT